MVKGKPTVVNPNMVLKKQTDEDKKLSEMMIPKKHKRLYNKIMYSQKKTRQEVFASKHIIFNQTSQIKLFFLIHRTRNSKRNVKNMTRIKRIKPTTDKQMFIVKLNKIIIKNVILFCFIFGKLINF